MMKNCSIQRSKNFPEFSAFSLEFAKILRLLEQFIQTVNGPNNKKNQLATIKTPIETNIWDVET